MIYSRCKEKKGENLMEYYLYYNEISDNFFIIGAPSYDECKEILKEHDFQQKNLQLLDDNLKKSSIELLNYPIYY